jgi:hypothetical protein
MKREREKKLWSTGDGCLNCGGRKATEAEKPMLSSLGRSKESMVARGDRGMPVRTKDVTLVSLRK